MYKNITAILGAATLVCGMSITTLHAAPPADVNIDEILSQAQNPADAKGGAGSRGGQSEHSMGVGSDGSAPQGNGKIPESVQNQFTAQGCYDYWWVSGNHTWKSKTYYFYAETDLSASTWTRYGSSTGPCDIPLTVDKIEVIGQTLSNNIVTTRSCRLSQRLRWCRTG